MATVYTELLERAAQILGSYDKLREFLGVPKVRLQLWLRGAYTPPADVFLKLVDVVSQESLNRLVDAAHVEAADSQAGRYAQVQALDSLRASIHLKARLLRQATEKLGIPKHETLSVSDFMGRTFGPDEAALVLQIALDAAVLATGAQFGSMQLAEEDGLHLILQHGLPQAFVDHFACVKGGTTCALALAEKRRVVVSDVESDPPYTGTPAGAALLKANVRAVQSTPLLSNRGEVLGVLSTHYDHPCLPNEFDLAILDHIGDRTAYWLQKSLPAIGLQKSLPAIHAS